MAKPSLISSFVLVSLWTMNLFAITPEDLEKRYKDLPTVPESEMPELTNEPTSFRGLIEHEGLEGHTWVAFPFVENPGSLGFDPQGRLYVAEANRFWQGVPDLRGANEYIRDDFQAVTVEDRMKLYEKFASSIPLAWYTRVADRIILLEDKDGNDAADFRTVFSDRFKEPLDGIGFSILADDGSVYFTCIPNVWKLTDTDGDGVADEEEAISTGYGVRISFIGHDLHGITRGPDGMLYFSVGDRGYHVTDAHGKVHEGSGRGAIFRCESDGSGLEVFCEGLRNPQELAFDNYGNLFTFDNTGDIGDLARMVYALEGTDSGWDMSHQSPHHYVTNLDWGDFHPEKSMWVKERMYDLYNEEQPQWVYPPASHVARGPSGVTYLTGASLPEDLREKFLLTNYRGPSEGCTVLLVDVRAKGAGYVAMPEEVLFKGIGASDVELGYDGAIYLCDFGGGWSVNENGSIQVAKSKDPAEVASGAGVAALFKAGFADRSVEELTSLLSHVDRRVRQAAQFALVDRGHADTLKATAENQGDLFPRLHAIWGLGQLGRRETEVVSTLIGLLDDQEGEVRANAARVLGDLRSPAAKAPLLTRLSDDASLRVRSLAAVALSRIGDSGDEEITSALFSAVVKNDSESPDIVLRHALLTGLDRIATSEAAAEKSSSSSREERLVALLTLRRHESPLATAFLDDEDPLIAREAVRAIYDTGAVDTDAGEILAALGDKTASLPESVQRRIVASNYRKGGADHAREMVKLAGNAELEHSVRKAALIGLKAWDTPIVTDPVHGTYRPVPVVAEGRSNESLAGAIGEDLKQFLTGPHDSDLITLAMELATETGIQLDPATLMAQVKNTGLNAELRVAILNSLVQSDADGIDDLITELLNDSEYQIRAAAITHGFDHEVEGVAEKATTALKEDKLEVARASLAGLAKAFPEMLPALWKDRQSALRKGLWLDAYLLLSEAGHADADAYMTSDANAVFQLSLEGGNAEKGKIVFQNQGACLQCHKVGKDGGVQGPDLTAVAKRLTRDKILESIYNPGAEISPGYGMTSVTLKSGDSIVGRLSTEAEDHLMVVGLDNNPVRVERSDVKEVAPPVSAMPPVAAALPPRDLRDLVAFLAAQQGGGKKKDDSSHGDDDEAIAK
ncbi:MAG: HEAT repeat domain-containing protein [Verrucomicrobiales bacterium]|nr:HEAT repeat domain-containing protein [Verrucomicrobiales bacterium]